MSLSGLYKSTTFLSISPMGPLSFQRDIPQGPLAPILLGSAFAVGTGVAMGSIAFTWAAISQAFLISVVASYALSALTPKPSMPSGGNNYASVNALTSAGPTAIIYGATRIGGVTFYQEVTGSNKVLHKLIALAGHEVNAISDVYINDEIATINGSGYVTSPSKYVTFSKDSVNAGNFVVGSTYKISNTGGGGDNPTPTNFVAIGAINNNVGTTFTATGAGSGDGSATPTIYRMRILKHLGADNQVVDSVLNAESSAWTSNHRARGIAYIYARMEFDADAFPNGVPVITAVVSGRKVYDPRTSTTVYSNNPALCLRDYLIYSNVADASEIDDTLFSTAANICDENVNLDGGGTQKRYTTNGSFNSDIKPKDAFDYLLSSMGGMIWYSQGKWGCKAAAWTSPVLAFSEDDLRSDISVKTRNSRRDGFNKISGIFKGPESNYFETNYPTLAPASFLAVDNYLESELELNLPFVDNSATAQRISKIALYRNREQLRISASFGMRAYQLSVGDIVQISNQRLGFSSKSFEVVEWKFGLSSDLSLIINMTLQEISTDVFDWDADETAFESNNTTLLSPFSVPDVSIALSQEYRIANEKLTNILVVDVTSYVSFGITDNRVDNVEIVYKKDTDTKYSVLGIGDLGRFEILDIDTPLAGAVTQIVYEVRARAINSLGVKGEYTSISIIVEADTTGPDAPLNFVHQLSAGSIFFSWTASTALDLSYYKIWHSSSASAVWADGSVVPIIEKVARPATTISYPALSGTFFIEPYDKSGNSGDVASLVVLPIELPQLGITTSDIENPLFQGVKTNVSLSGSTIIMTSYATAGATGTYVFTGHIDTGTIRTVRISDELVIARKHSAATSGSVNWDDISSSYNWNQWPDNWDTWTDEDANFGDFSVLTYVSATDDNPASSPSWGAYTIAAGEKSGRAFRFKAILSNTSNKVTPSISVLKGIVEY